MPGDPSRTRIGLADGRRLVVDSAFVTQARLERGASVSGDTLVRLLEEGEVGAARERALHYLRDRDRSRAEVERRLARYGYHPRAVADVTEWLIGYGYVDDRRFAEAFARSRTRASWGPRRLLHELLTRGIDRGLAEEVVAAVREQTEGSDAVVDGLAALVARRFGRDLQTDPVGARRRIQAYLPRRGYDWGVIRSVVDRVLASNGEHAAGDT